MGRRRLLVAAEVGAFLAPPAPPHDVLAQRAQHKRDRTGAQAKKVPARRRIEHLGAIVGSDLDSSVVLSVLSR